jgi:hypothetical protein
VFTPDGVGTGLGATVGVPPTMFEEVGEGVTTCAVVPAVVKATKRIAINRGVGYPLPGGIKQTCLIAFAIMALSSVRRMARFIEQGTNRFKPKCPNVENLEYLIWCGA